MTFTAARPQPTRERLGLMARLFIAVLIIVVFEGAFRKWVSDSMTTPLVGLRDFLSVLGIFYAIKKDRYKRAPELFRWLIILTLIVVVWGLLQTLIIGGSLLVLIIGFRFWLLYLWFSVLAAVSMSSYDFRRISQLMVILLIGMTPLVVWQHFLPSSSFWNKQIEEGEVFKVTADIVRTTGTFSFTMGFTTFLVFSTPFIFLGMERDYMLWRGRWLSFAGIVALVSATIVSGSRGAILMFALQILVYLGVLLVSVKNKGRMHGIKFLLVTAFILIILLSVFGRAVNANLERFETASQSETFSGRLAYNFLPNDTKLSFLGAGIGLGTNFASAIKTGQRGFLLAESENSRLILEAGLLGWLILLVKLIVLFIGTLKALKLTRRSGSPLTVMLWVSSGLALLSWPLAGQLTVNALGYLLVGLAIASLHPKGWMSKA